MAVIYLKKYIFGFLIIVSVFMTTIFIYSSCGKKDTIRDELIEKMNEYDETLSNYDSFEYSLGAYSNISNSYKEDISSKIVTYNVNPKKKIIESQSNGDKYYVKKNTLIKQYKNECNLVVEKSEKLDLYDILYSTTYDKIFFKSANYDKLDDDTYTVLTNLKSVKNSSFYSVFEDFFKMIESNINVEKVKYTCDFSSGDLEFSIYILLTNVTISGASYNRPFYYYDARVELQSKFKISNINKHKVDLYDSSLHDYALAGTFNSALENLYGLKTVNSKTKIIEYSIYDSYNTNANYLPINIVDEGNYDFSCSTNSFEIYDKNNRKVEGNYYKKGLYFIRLKANSVSSYVRIYINK